jgi:hypothetical protein
MKSMRKSKKEKKEKPFCITEVYHKLLVAISRYHLVTASQLCRLYYSPGTLTTVKTRLRKLEQEGYVLTLRMPTSRGNAPFVYTLANKGLKIMEAAGQEANLSYRPGTERDKEKNYLYLWHTLETNNFLIDAALLQEANPLYPLLETRHDRDLRRSPFYVAVDKGGRVEKVTIIPDGFLVFGSPTGELHLWVELDRGTIAINNFRRKVRGIVTFLDSGEYEKVFHTSELTIAIPTTAGEKRAEHVIKWIEAELTAMGKSAYAGIFFVAAVPALTEPPWTPEQLFLSESWSCPFQRGRFRLLGG